MSKKIIIMRHHKQGGLQAALDQLMKVVGGMKSIHILNSPLPDPTSLAMYIVKNAGLDCTTVSHDALSRVNPLRNDEAAAQAIVEGFSRDDDVDAVVVITHMNNVHPVVDFVTQLLDIETMINPMQRANYADGWVIDPAQQSCIRLSNL